MTGLLTSGATPTGTTGLSDCMAENSSVLGQRYVSELRRNYRRWDKLRNGPATWGVYEQKERIGL